MSEPMIPGNPRWQEFLDRLEGPEGCDFKKDENDQTTWKCAGGYDKTLAAQILLAMGLGDVAIVESMTFYEQHGGHCDCEILFNVAVVEGP